VDSTVRRHGASSMIAELGAIACHEGLDGAQLNGVASPLA
jgi:hypothetical protein